MFQFPPQIYLDFASFWLGVLTASIAWFLFRKTKPRLSQIIKWAKNQILIIREKLTSNTEVNLRQKTLQHAQAQHLSSSFCALDEILIQPRFLTPPYQLSSEGTFPDLNSIQQAIPYTPDTPEFASEYGSPTISLEQALMNGVNIAIMGKPGSGKTVALSHLASRLARREVDAFSNTVPILLDAIDLLTYLPGEEAIDTIYKTLTANPLYLKTVSLENVIKNLFLERRVFLLIDNLDQIPRQGFTRVIHFIQLLSDQFPWLRLVTTLSAQYIDGVLETDLQPLAISTWGSKEKTLFAKNWGETWAKYHADGSQKTKSPRQAEKIIDKLLINTWLFQDTKHSTPLAFTLQVWSAYAGDARGPNSSHGIEAYLRRLIPDLPEKELPDLQKIAFSAIREGAVTFTREHIHDWLKSIGSQLEIEPAHSQNPLRDVLSTCLEKDILKLGNGKWYRFTHPSIAGYIASKACSSLDYKTIQDVFQIPNWIYSSEAFRFVSAVADMTPMATDLRSLHEKDNFLQKNLLKFGQLLPFLPDDSKSKDYLLKYITKEISENPLLETKQRLAVLLATSGDDKTSSIFRYLLSSPDADVRRVAVMGCGYLQDTKSVETIINLLDDHKEIGQAACLALVNIATPQALEAVAHALLTGDDNLRRAAAESLANHPHEGYPTIKDASELDNLNVRYASVYGLKRIKEKWSMDILEEMRIEEDEWVVRDAAQEAFETLQGSSPFTPSPLQPIHEAPLLKSYASEHDIELNSTQNKYQMLLEILSTGSIEQKFTALYYIQMKGFGSVFPDIYNCLRGDNEEIQRTAANTVWHLSLTGMDIPKLESSEKN